MASTPDAAPAPVEPGSGGGSDPDWRARRRRWWTGVGVALVVGGVVGVVLGFLAMMPLFLGLFFFLLLGLIPGAVLFRYADPVRPVPAGSLWVGSAAILIVIFCVSGYVEYRSLPDHVAVKVRRSISGGFPKGYRREALDAHVAGIVRDYLRERYGSDGIVGYVKWAAGSGRIEIPAATIRLPRLDAGPNQPPVELELAKPAVYRLHQPATLWCLRVGASLLLLVLGIVLQVTPLRNPAPTPDDPTDGDAQVEERA